MSRSEIIEILKKFKETHAEKYGILLMGVFGSVDRDHALKIREIFSLPMPIQLMQHSK